MTSAMPFLNEATQPAFVTWLREGSEEKRRHWALHCNVAHHGPGLLGWGAQQEWASAIPWMQRIAECLPFIPFESTAWTGWLNLPKHLPHPVQEEAFRTIASFFLNRLSVSNHASSIVNNTFSSMISAINTGYPNGLPLKTQELWQTYMEPYSKLSMLEQLSAWNDHVINAIPYVSNVSGQEALRRSFACFSPVVWRRHLAQEKSANLRIFYPVDDWDAILWLPQTKPNEPTFHYEVLVRTLFPQAHRMLETILSDNDWNDRELIQYVAQLHNTPTTPKTLDYTGAIV